MISDYLESMENYIKGEICELDEPTSFPVLHDTCVKMRVTSNSKIRNLISYATIKFKDPSIHHVVWSGTGKAISKTISCAEIMKRTFKGLHQISSLHYKRVEEYWEPQVAGLDRLKVNKDIPAISILLSSDAVDASQPGYQAPGVQDSFWHEISTKQTRVLHRRPPYRRPKPAYALTTNTTMASKTVKTFKNNKNNKDDARVTSSQKTSTRDDRKQESGANTDVP